MLKLTSYFQMLKQRLGTDERLRHCFDNYIDDARTDCLKKTQNCIDAFRMQRDIQFADNEHLLPAYAAAFDGLAYLAMRLAYLGVLEGDNSGQRLACAKRLLLELCTTYDWVTQGKEEDRFHADLWTGSLCAQTAVLYTVVRSQCTEDECRIIRQGMLKNGILAVYREWLDPEEHRHALDSMGHNWWLVIVCGAGVASLALREEEPVCAELFSKISKSIHQWFCYPGNVLQNKKANFGPDGDYIEFLGYMTYGFSTYVMLESFYYAETGDDSLLEAVYLKPQIKAYLSNFYWVDGHLRLANFGDTPAWIVKHQHVIYYLSERFHCKELFKQQELMSDGPNEYEDFLFYPPAAEMENGKACRLPLLCVYPHSGYAVCRTGYGPKDRFFAMKTGESWNHNHLDAGTFILTDGGKEIAVDSGTCNYGRRDYREYYSAPQAHNVVLFNGEGQDADMLDSGTKFSGTFPSWIDAHERQFSYLLADCTGPCAGHFVRFYRHVLFLRDWILLIDDLQTYQEGELEWRMHYEGELCGEKGAYFFQNGDGITPFYPLYPLKQTIRTGEGLRDGEMLSARGMRDPKRAKRQRGKLPAGSYLSLTSRMNGRRAKLVCAIGRTGTEFPSQAPSVCEVDGGFLILMESLEGSERILVNNRADGSYMHKNSWLTAGGLHTDAFLVYEKRDEKKRLTDATVINGSRLLIGDELSLGCLMKLDGHFRLREKSCSVSINMEQELTICTAAGKSSVRVKPEIREYRW